MEERERSVRPDEGVRRTMSKREGRRRREARVAGGSRV